MLNFIFHPHQTCLIQMTTIILCKAANNSEKPWFWSWFNVRGPIFFMYESINCRTCVNMIIREKTVMLMNLSGCLISWICWITAVKDCRNLDTASDERGEISSRPKATFLSQRIIKPDVIRAKGVSPVIISLQWNTQQDCMKASWLIRPCFNILAALQKTPKPRNEPNPVMQNWHHR